MKVERRTHLTYVEHGVALTDSERVILRRAASIAASVREQARMFTPEFELRDVDTTLAEIEHGGREIAALGFVVFAETDEGSLR